MWGPASQHFRGRERRGSGDLTVRGAESVADPRDAEIGELRLSVFGEEDVRGFDVAVQDVGSVGRLQRAGQLDAQPDSFGPREGAVPADTGVQRVVRVIGHHQVRKTVVRDTRLQHGDDVRMPRHTSHRPLFTQEPLEIRRVGTPPEHLHSDIPVE